MCCWCCWRSSCGKSHWRLLDIKCLSWSLSYKYVLLCYMEYSKYLVKDLAVSLSRQILDVKYTLCILHFRPLFPFQNLLCIIANLCKCTCPPWDASHNGCTQEKRRINLCPNVWHRKPEYRGICMHLMQPFMQLLTLRSACISFIFIISLKRIHTTLCVECKRHYLRIIWKFSNQSTANISFCQLRPEYYRSVWDHISSTE